MKSALVLMAVLFSQNSFAIKYCGFVSAQKCVYSMNGSTHTSSCSNSNTECQSDGKCTVDHGNGLIISGDVEDGYELAEMVAGKCPAGGYHQFNSTDRIDLSASKLNPGQVQF